MATSDNVVRAGLTPKLKDVDTLVRMLTYNYGAPTIITPTPYFFNGQPTQHTKIFDPPIPEFTLMETIIKSADNKTALFSAINGPSIIVVIEGDAKFEASVVSAEAASTTNNVVLGHVYFVPALTSLNVTAGEQGIKFYRAYCEA